MTLDATVVPKQGRAAPVWREVGWWSLVLFLSGVDATGFKLNMGLMIPDTQIYLVWVIVIGCTGAALLLPWRFGVASSERRQGEGGGLSMMVGSVILWTILGVFMFVARVTSSPIGPLTTTKDVLSPTSSGPVATGISAERIYVAIFLFVVYAVTAMMASKHAYDLTDRRLTRQLVAERNGLQRHLRREREHQTQEEHLLKTAQGGANRLDEMHKLDEEVATAFANLDHEAKIERLSMNLGDPGATEILLSEQQRPAADMPGR